MEAVAGVTMIVVNTGVGVTAVTVTVKLPLAVLLWVSLAEQLTVVVAIGKVEPEAGTHVTGRDPSTASLAVAVKLTTAPDALVACDRDVCRKRQHGRRCVRLGLLRHRHREAAAGRVAVGVTGRAVDRRGCDREGRAGSRHARHRPRAVHRVVGRGREAHHPARGTRGLGRDVRGKRQHGRRCVGVG